MLRFALILCVSLSAQAQILKSSVNLFDQAKLDNKGKTPEQIVKESRDTYEKFVALNVNLKANGAIHPTDRKKPRHLSVENGQRIIDESIKNPVVSSTPVVNYDPDSKGIGYCFGRAMFAHLYLVLAGYNRANIKKAFIVGPMMKRAWGWHMVTIVQSKDAEGKEIWLALDPNFGKPVEMKEWYDYWLTTSDNGKLRLYITESSKFAISTGRYNDRTLSNKFYHGYFKDMRKWFEDNDISQTLVFDPPQADTIPRLSPRISVDELSK